MTIVVTGIGADGWAGLPDHARAAIAACDVLFGGPRQLALVPLDLPKVPWPSPLLPALDELFADHAGTRIGVLASGDPMLSGIGTTLVRRFGNVEIVPAVSSVTLARARLGWSAEETEVVSVVGRNVHRLTRVLTDGARILALSSDTSSPAKIAELLTAHGFGESRMTVLEQLGGPAERRIDGLARTWSAEVDPLNIVAVDCVGRGLPTLPGLPDDAFEHDGQLTKRDLRALALARLAPSPGELLWDVGAGAGSVAVEWARAHPRNRAIALERVQARAERITRNAENLGVPDIRVVTGSAPDALVDLPAPDAVFLGGGLTAWPACWDALAPGGRIVAHAVTLESEQALANAYAEHGGELVRIAVEHAAPLGGFTGWSPARTVTQWSQQK
ncbi:precorrin-6y C5,15-methyltransferase (decarboxylating) subunit CbiE [Amycolatopsis sp.]|uniref:precorrin-6y C5,15-methyltransferase (decarboxylating) subunit CbiE n=1 Tax=Amycolatopsis sp. TaxID=37632 RepID=UPI002C4DE012|nr:precorrin-6y C5,15-methyltransferase (decarboxylating) subunit CbiE [Amycolatopsis sp.]HVV12911.1 precorrin-6y C5,15-methyltransferase (decarboxylating) subunit CbiE [Amycolatopsis sp.]